MSYQKTIFSICFGAFLLCITMSNASDKISLQLAWKHQFQFAGYYAALHKGYYKQAGLEVTIVEGGVGKFAREEILEGRAHYGIAGAELLLHRKDSEPFVVLAPIFQHSPSILLVRKDSGISNLQDLLGKNVMLLPGKKDADILAAFLNEGISLDSIQRLDQSYNLNDLIEGRTDAVSAYITNEPWQLIQEGVEPVTISPQTYGVDFYSDCLFTTENEIKKYPQRVKHFLDASLRGWEYAMSHPDEIIHLLLTEYSVKKSRKHLSYEAESIRKIMMPKLVQIGHMNPGRWRHIAKTYEKLGLIDANFPLDGFLYNPNPVTDYQNLKKIVFGAIAIIFLFGMGTIALLIFNRKLRIEVNHRKITEEKLKKEKELNETILNIAPYTMYIFDIVEQRNVYANKEIFTSLGYTAEEIQGMRGDFIEELMHPDDFKVWHTQTINRYSRLKDNDYIENEYRMKHRDGTWRWLFSKETVFNRLPDGSPKQLFGITIDITEKKNTEIDKQRLHAHLAQSQKMEAIGILAGGIAHDFNNILGIITGNISFALSHINHDDDLHGTLIDVQEGANQAQNLTQQLLTFSKGGEPIKKVIQMNQLVQDASGFVVSGAKSKCEFNLAPDLWCVEVDPGQLNQVISNIVINAEQSMPNGGVITIQTENAQIDTDTDINVPDGKYIKISIQDQGIGIQDRYIEHIFDPYFTTKQIGSGLGLATSYSIIKKHEGHITVFSEIGNGTVFHIYLPASEKEAQLAEKEYNNQHIGQGSILIMDDQEPILKMLKRILNRMGYETELSKDGAEAIEKYRKAFKTNVPFDLVILDLTIPGGMGGVKTIIEILKINPDAKVVVSSGYSNDPIMANYEDYGFCGVVPKPYTKAQLSALLNTLVGDHKAAPTMSTIWRRIV